MTHNELDTNDDDGIIERCPHDRSHHFSIIDNNLIRDPNLTPHTAWLIIFLLSNKDGWIIRVQQIVNFLKGKKGYGRDAVRAMFEEACEVGYMKRVDYLNSKNLKRVKYVISETPKFKKSFRHTENQEVEISNAADQAHNNNQGKEVLSKDIKEKKIIKKEKPSKNVEPSTEPPKKAYRENVFLSEDEYIKLKEKFGDWLETGLDKLEYQKSVNGSKYRSDYAVFKQGGWLHDLWEKTQQAQNKGHFGAFCNKLAESNKLFAQKVEKKYSRFKAEKDFLDFGYPSPGISYTEHGFKDQVLSRLRKYDLDVTGLE